MTLWFVSRHHGAVDWAQRQGLAVDEWVAHLDVSRVGAGDTVIGSLPVHMAAAVCRRGARFLNLTLTIPAEWRGKELTADELDMAGAVLEEYFLERLK